MSNQTPSKTARLTLSPLEGRRLFGFLTELAECGDPATGFSGFDDFLEILGEANALATWLRENVNVELEGPEAAKVLEALESTLLEKGVALTPTRSYPAFRTNWQSAFPGGTAEQIRTN